MNPFANRDPQVPRQSNTRLRLGMAFACLIILLCFVGWDGVSRLQRLDAQLEDKIYARWTQVQIAREAFRLSNLNNRIVLEVFLLQDDAEIRPLLAQRAANTDRITTLVGTLTSGCQSETDRHLLAAVAVARTPYIESYKRALAMLLEEHRHDEARLMIVHVTLPLIVLYHDAWNAFVEAQAAEVERAVRQSKREFASGRRHFFLIVLAAGLLTIAIGFFTTRRIGRESADRLRAEAALQRNHDQLEQRVQERTSQLTAEIAERERVQAKGQAAESRYKTLFEGSHDALMTLEPPLWRFTSGNPATVSMFKTVSAQDFISHEPWAFSPERQPDGRASDEKAREMIETAMREGSHFFEWTHARIGGETFPATVLLTRVEIGEHVFLQSTVRDITEQKLAEAAMARVSRQNEQLLLSAGEGVCGLDLEGRTTFTNPAGARLLGYSREELLGLPQHALVHHTRADGTLYPQEECPIYLAFKDGLMHHADTDVFWRKDGTNFPVDYTSTPVRDEHGALQGAIVVFRDITTRKLAEAYREAAREVLEILNESGKVAVAIPRVLAALKTQTGFDAVGIRLQDGDDFPYFAQKGLSADFLRTENTLIARAVDGGVCRDKDGNVSLECTCGLVISGKIPPAHPLSTPGGSFWTNDSFPLLDLPADQDPRLHPRNTCIHHGYTSVALVPIRGADRIVGLIHINDRRKDCFTRETIEGLENMAAHIGSALMRKRAEAERETLQAQLIQAQKMETVGTLARGMAHEMNNPIMGIMNYAQLIKDRAAGNAVFAEFADEILLEGKRVATMTHSLLSITQQQEAVPFVATAPAAMVAAALTMAAEPARERGIALSCSIPDDLPPASCRPGQIGQILAGLLTNAMEALEEAPAEDLPREKKIVVSAREVVIREPSSVITDRLSVEDSRPNTDHFLRITVEDNGPGIPNDIRERVFDPFFTTKDRTRHSGLGLWSSRSVIQEHSGNISLESEVGKWTRFSIDLPVGLKS